MRSPIFQSLPRIMDETITGGLFEDTIEQIMRFVRSLHAFVIHQFVILSSVRNAPLTRLARQYDL